MKSSGDNMPRRHDVELLSHESSVPVLLFWVSKYELVAYCHSTLILIQDEIAQGETVRLFNGVVMRCAAPLNNDNQIDP